MLLHGLPASADFCVEMEGVNGSGIEKLKALLQREDRPTAFVGSDDMLALALERACNQLQLSIPDDISIIAFNNSLYAQLASPQLTAVDINSFLLGQEAANQILNHADNPNLTTTKTIVPHTIIERDSCRKIKEKRSVLSELPQFIRTAPYKAAVSVNIGLSGATCNP